MHLRHCTAAVLTVFLFSLAVSGGELLDRIARNMGAIRTLQAEFEQEKQLKAFAFPVRLTGELCMEQNGRLAWIVREPLPYTCIIEGSRLTQWDADTDKTVAVDTSRNPSLRILAESIRRILAGDPRAMLDRFDVVREPNPLELKPKPGAAAFLARIQFRFSEDLARMEEIVMTESSGDVTRIRFRNSRINENIPEKKWQPRQK